MNQNETQGKFAQKFDENSPQMNHGKQFGKTLGKEPGDLSEPQKTTEADPETEAFLKRLAEQEKVRAHKLDGVRTVLVAISAKAMVFDVNSLRQKIVLTYPDSAVFFITTDGKPIGSRVPGAIDLLIDFTGPGSRQGIFYARKLRRMAKFAVGRNAGLFRKKLYDRVFDEKALAGRLPSDLLDRERFVQQEVLKMAGVPLWQSGDTPPDRGKVTPLELPPLAKV